MTELLQDPAREWNEQARAKVEVAGVNVGDRVRVVAQDGTRGGYGVLTAVDSRDVGLTFRVRYDDDIAGASGQWVYDVRAESPSPAAAVAEESGPSVEELSRQIVQLNARLDETQDRATRSAREVLQVRVELTQELTMFRRQVSEKAYELKERNDWCSGVEEWLEEHGCPTKRQTWSGTVTVTFTVSGTTDDNEGVDDSWLRQQVSDASLDLDVDYEMDDWTVDSVDLSSESEWA
jgi:hypothetical protein